MTNYLYFIKLYWLVLNKPSLIIDKTVCMTIGKYSDSVPKDILIQIDVIKRVENTNYLG